MSPVLDPKFTRVTRYRPGELRKYEGFSYNHVHQSVKVWSCDSVGHVQLRSRCRPCKRVMIMHYSSLFAIILKKHAINGWRYNTWRFESAASSMFFLPFHDLMVRIWDCVVAVGYSVRMTIFFSTWKAFYRGPPCFYVWPKLPMSFWHDHMFIKIGSSSVIWDFFGFAVWLEFCHALVSPVYAMWDFSFCTPPPSG